MLPRLGEIPSPGRAAISLKVRPIPRLNEKPLKPRHFSLRPRSGECLSPERDGVAQNTHTSRLGEISRSKEPKFPPDLA
ncbi:hypothetical protein DEO72_LG4g478 [Vigna unguiculata]|uniref:Uncharacterized protein n=1 Tax=Vigna unguiculata TaxID=3917 RepID=A0A4D6LL85_VIGUN|nr:hypothetical protein DEO72_LG4g478 [Vigna unguiculata]